MQEEEAAEAAARFQELEGTLTEAQALLADEAEALPQLQEELAEAQRQVRFARNPVLGQSQ